MKNGEKLRCHSEKDADNGNNDVLHPCLHICIFMAAIWPLYVRTFFCFIFDFKNMFRRYFIYG